MNKHYMAQLFGGSPVRPLQAHMEKVQSCVEKLPDLVAAMIAEDHNAARDCYNAMSALESEADDLKREVRLKLPGTLFLPITRVDLLDMLNAQDKMANRAQDVAGLMLGRKMQIPEPIQGSFKALVKRSVAAVAQASDTVKELNELLESGFRDKERQRVASMVQAVDDIERDTDQLQVELRNGLFKIEAELPAVNVMFLYQVIKGVGALADRAENLGHQLELLLAR